MNFYLLSLVVTLYSFSLTSLAEITSYDQALEPYKAMSTQRNQFITGFSSKCEKLKLFQFPISAPPGSSKRQLTDCKELAEEEAYPWTLKIGLHTELSSLSKDLKETYIMVVKSNLEEDKAGLPKRAISEGNEAFKHNKAFIINYLIYQTYLDILKEN